MNRIVQGIHFNPGISEDFNETNIASLEFQYFVVDSGEDREVVRETLLDFEQEFLNEYVDHPLCWNVSKDSRATMKGLPVSDKTRTMLSQALIGRKKSDVTKAKMSAAQLGHAVSESTIRAIKQANQRAIYVKGKAYRSTSEAAKGEGVSEMTAYRKLNHPKYRSFDWNYVDDIFPV
jgi:hypothetical protein